MTEHVVPIHINLVALRDSAQRELQRLTDILRYHRSASVNHSEQGFDEYFDFFSIQPSQNTAMDFPTARAAAESWTLLHVLRDAIDVINAFLESAFRVCSLYSLSKEPSITIAVFSKIARQIEAFHRLGLPKKIAKLKDDFAVGSDLDTYIVSLNDARNCLVHRLGVVTTEETGSAATFTVRWMALRVEGHSPDGTEIVPVDTPREFPGGWQVRVSTAPEERTYRLGERIALDYRQLVGAVFSHQTYINSLVASVEAYARSLGVQFLSPHV